MQIKPRDFQKTIPPWLLETFLIFRGLYFLGAKYTCPCCGWRLRAFTHGGTSFQIRHHGYCPRCDAKARHRRDWLYLANETDLFSKHIRLLHISPRYSLSRRFIKMKNLEYIGIDLYPRRNIKLLMDLVQTPICSDSIDTAICIHVLEHIEKDRTALQEIYRVLKPRGWVLISVPIRLEESTFEDPSIKTPEARQLAFGETGHVRFYGIDLKDRLEETGFKVHLEVGKDIDKEEMNKYGLLDDENIFFCTKP